MNISYLTKKKYSELSDWEKDVLDHLWIINGCGGAWNGIKNRFIRYVLKKVITKLRIVFIEADCDKHDFSYWQWIRKDYPIEWLKSMKVISPEYLRKIEEYDRKTKDIRFYTAIIQDISRLELWLIAVLWYTLLAYIFYCAVRIGWKDYYNNF